MTRLVSFWFIILAFATAWGAAPGQDGSVPLRVMTYNLRFGELASIDSLASFIRSQDPDFVALQEVDVRTMRGLAPHMSGKDMLTELAAKTGMFGYYGRTIDFAGGYYGIGMLSKYPAERVEKIDLPNPQNIEPRVLLGGVFEMPQSRQLYFASVHFDHKHAETRKLQAQTVINHISVLPYATIVAGDFNSLPDDDGIKAMSEICIPLTNTDCTFPADKPNIKIDYIFGYPASNFSLIDTSVIDTQLSDHRPVISNMRVSYELLRECE